LKLLTRGLSGIDISWVESPFTSPGIPDMSYCYAGIEGWIELKAFPNIYIRPTQVRWFKDRVAAGGFPLLLVQSYAKYHLVPGCCIKELRKTPSEVNVAVLATTTWVEDINIVELLAILKNPESQYVKHANHIKH
jgi:hypothetical protein